MLDNNEMILQTELTMIDELRKVLVRSIPAEPASDARIQVDLERAKVDIWN